MDFSKFRRNRSQEDMNVVLWMEDDARHIISIVRMGGGIFEVRGCDDAGCYAVQTNHPEPLMTKEFAIIQMKIAMGKKKRRRIKF